MAKAWCSLLMLVLVSLHPLVPSVSSFSPDSPTDRRVLVLVDDFAIRSSHSLFFNSLSSRGFNLEFRLADDPKLALQRYGQYLYDGLILFSPSAQSERPIRLPFSFFFLVLPNIWDSGLSVPSVLYRICRDRHCHISFFVNFAGRKEIKAFGGQCGF